MSSPENAHKDWKHAVAARAAQEIAPGQVVNLGIGLPTLILRHIPPEHGCLVHSENGILGMGLPCALDEADPMCIDAGGGYVRTRQGASFFDSATSFAIVRGGRLDIAFLGTLEVAENGDLANWIIPGRFAPGIGGAMELAQKARRLVVLTAHTTRTGEPKILGRCTLPLTAKGCVDRIITELAVLDPTPDGLVLRELARGVEADEVLEKTGAPVRIPDGPLPTF
jgi:3-oxoacid CoA-transferase B subunit